MQVGRIGTGVPLPSGEPASACEAKRWHELAPTRVIAEGETANGWGTTMYTAVVEGHGVYQKGAAEPLEVPPLLPAMQEPALSRSHMEPIERVDDKSAAMLGWTLGGLGAMGVGLGVAAAIQDESGTGAAIAGLSGLALGLVGVIVALASQPSGMEQLQADAYRQIFVTEHEDFAAVQRGVDKLNVAQRQRCGGAAAR